MKTGHWFAFAVILIVGYFLGVKFPGLFGQLKSTVTGA